MHRQNCSGYCHIFWNKTSGGSIKISVFSFSQELKMAARSGKNFKVMDFLRMYAALAQLMTENYICTSAYQFLPVVAMPVNIDCHQSELLQRNDSNHRNRMLVNTRFGNIKKRN
jgi:hypothetical protein